MLQKNNHFKNTVEVLDSVRIVGEEDTFDSNRVPF
jgi:hypothetical protein